MSHSHSDTQGWNTEKNWLSGSALVREEGSTSGPHPPCFKGGGIWRKKHWWNTEKNDP